VPDCVEETGDGKLRGARIEGVDKRKGGDGFGAVNGDGEGVVHYRDFGVLFHSRPHDPTRSHLPAPHEQVYLGGVLGQENGLLGCGIAPANDSELFFAEDWRGTLVKSGRTRDTVSILKQEEIVDRNTHVTHSARRNSALPELVLARQV